MSLPIAPVGAAHSAQTARAADKIDPQALKAARDFEAIFLRTLLSSLEKTTSVSGGGKLNTGQSTYGSMVVGAMADQISSSGGIGLSEVVARSLTQHMPVQPAAAAGPEQPKPPK